MKTQDITNPTEWAGSLCGSPDVAAHAAIHDHYTAFGSNSIEEALEYMNQTQTFIDEAIANGGKMRDALDDNELEWFGCWDDRLLTQAWDEVLADFRANLGS